MRGHWRDTMDLNRVKRHVVHTRACMHTNTHIHARMNTQRVSDVRRDITEIYGPINKQTHTHTCIHPHTHIQMYIHSPQKTTAHIKQQTVPKHDFWIHCHHVFFLKKLQKANIQVLKRSYRERIWAITAAEVAANSFPPGNGLSL